jgi:hypothetical protein
VQSGFAVDGFERVFGDSVSDGLFHLTDPFPGPAAKEGPEFVTIDW